KLGQTPLSLDLESKKMPVTWQLKMTGYESKRVTLQSSSPKTTVRLAPVEIEKSVETPGPIGSQNSGTKLKTKKQAMSPSPKHSTRIKKKRPARTTRRTQTSEPRSSKPVTRPTPSAKVPETKRRAVTPKPSKVKSRSDDKAIMEKW
ncbi:MAG: hypothetical protein ACPGQS_09020, partial [Bradymonadia bacterium]